MNKAYIHTISSFLPNNAVSNDEIEDYLGIIDKKSSRIKRIILQRNGIKKRYYAITKDSNISHNNAEMTSVVVEMLFENGVDKNNVEMLCCATSSPDQLAPSHASMVHGRLKINPLEIASFSGVCLTSLQALKNLFHAIKLGEKNNGICTASEFVSPIFRVDDSDNMLVNLAL